MNAENATYTLTPTVPTARLATAIRLITPRLCRCLLDPQYLFEDFLEKFLAIAGVKWRGQTKGSLAADYHSHIHRYQTFKSTWVAEVRRSTYSMPFC